MSVLGMGDDVGVIVRPIAEAIKPETKFPPLLEVLHKLSR